MKKVSNLRFLFSAKNGFTLIELLIVIAVLGILAAVVLVAIDPAQQLARGRDSGRKTSIGQLGRALQAYYTTQSAYPAGLDWTAATNILVSSGEIKTFPSNPAYNAAVIATGIPCTINPQDPDGAGSSSAICYAIDNTPPDTVIFARLESRAENAKCVSATPNAWFVWSSYEGRAGIVCRANVVGTGEPDPGVQVFLP